MPMNPKQMARRAVFDGERLREERILEDIEAQDKVLRNKPPKLGHKQQSCVYEMYAIWEPHLSNVANPIPTLERAFFDVLFDNYSKLLITEAMKILGIRSVRGKDHWEWTRPKYAPTEAMQIVHDRMLKEAVKTEARKGIATAKLREIGKPAAAELSELMVSSHYDVLRDVVLEKMRYKERTVKKAKAWLGILSIKDEDDKLWHWVWPAPEVQHWLLEQLNEGPIECTATYAKALADKNWSRLVVRWSIEALGGIAYLFLNGKAHWGMR